MSKKLTIKGWAVWCSRKDQGFLTAHWSFAGAVRQMNDIKEASHKDGLGCRHKVVACEIVIPSNPS